MNKIKVYLVVLVLFCTASSCLKTEAPEPGSLVMGEWIVDNVIANGQVGDQGLFDEDAVLHLDNNNTFLFVNVDGRASAGTWTSTETELTLNGNDNYVQTYTIEFVDWGKMHMYRNFSIAGGSAVEVRYLFRKVE